MARSFALGFAAVRDIQSIKAYSPNSDHLRVYCQEMSEKLRIEVIPTKGSEEAIRGSDIAFVAELSASNFSVG